ncbi:2-amino-4-hydroxy-6-hydroxymethyldihydropteridine diphosphokinase [Schaalia sp. lx-100]|uniref:2-amino-4-hydroxy-6- hydroxymethyldihydropteridine diphosphokinase n=1 Tax=Schaalia sp. lx-100 TaxID=2899081 RepID=UPI001E641314|nr:2-amino-4-hydroxy-6-hydroxymethyldihydropteridine diphosphokinase [Schaalia sp. lx-100]MCD4557668.1 2-amino-4-hydroxy-6-hydroxymethyldihydropteridine diphosphokinase [Schaalia sp. lx-100]
MTDRLDVITLTGVSAEGIHGVLPQEQKQPQLFRVDVSMWVDVSRAVGSDDLADTVSYADVAHMVIQMIQGPSVRLIETLAGRIAEAVMTYPRVVGAQVTVHKPEAPINARFSDIAVTLTRGHIPVGHRESTPQHADAISDAPAELSPPRRRTSAPTHSPLMWTDAVLALGGNVGNVPLTLRYVIEDLIEHPHIEIIEISPLLRTHPVLMAGQAAQEDHWNAVLLIRTTLSARELLDTTLRIEQNYGRLREERWGPRTVDIDLIQYGEEHIHEADLQLPHPRAFGRAFVLAPWLLADPDAVLVGHGRVADLLPLTQDRSGIVDAIEDWLEESETVLADSQAYLDSVHDGTGDAALTVGIHAQKETIDKSCAHIEDPAPENLVGSAGPTGGIPHAGPESVSAVVPPLAVPQMNVLPPTVLPSRVELLPESSRVGLAPSGDRDDQVWRALWQKWSQPGSGHHRERSRVQQDCPEALTSAAQPYESDFYADEYVIPENKWAAEQVPSFPAQEYAAHESTRETEYKQQTFDACGAEPAKSETRVSDNKSEQSTRHTEPVVQRRSIADLLALPQESIDTDEPALTHAGTEIHAADEENSARIPADVEDTTRIRETANVRATDEKTMQLPGWISRSNAAKRAAAQGRSAVKPATELPRWDFASAQVRIIDEDPAEHHADHHDESHAAEESAASSARYSRLVPDLPAEISRGPRQHEDTVPPLLRRSVTVRPTVTGQFPVIRDEENTR